MREFLKGLKKSIESRSKIENRISTETSFFAYLNLEVVTENGSLTKLLKNSIQNNLV